MKACWSYLYQQILLGLVLVAMTPAMGAPASPPKPNVIFILTDDMGWGDLGCYGHSQIKTPNLDRLAKEGILLEDFYVNAPVCSPSRAAFMTGRYPITVGMPHIVMQGEQAKEYGTVSHLDPSIMTVTRLFQDAGYATGQFGKWHLGFKDTPPIKDYGIDESVTAHGNGPQFPLYDSPKNDDARREFRARSTELIVDETIGFIERNKDKPFYVNLWTIVPHSPLVPTKEQLDVYPKLDQPLYIPHVSSHQIYYAMITDLDHHVGRLLDRLKELALEENTIIVFSSDNGPEHFLITNAAYSAVGSTGPFRGVKRSLYDGGIRVPFIARWPGKIPANTINQGDVVAAIDYLPTIASLCEVSVPSDLDIDGVNRADVLLGKSSRREQPVMWEWRTEIFSQPIHQSPRFALRDGPWKFLMNSGREQQELYHSPDDPAEMNNVSAENPELVEKYSTMLEEFAAGMPPGPVNPRAGQRDPARPDRKGANVVGSASE